MTISVPENNLTYWKVSNYICMQLGQGRAVSYDKRFNEIYSWTEGRPGSLTIVSLEDIFDSVSGLDV